MHRIALVGTGNMARALAHSLSMQVVVVAGRNDERVREVATICGGAVGIGVAALSEHEFDVLWIATADSAIHDIANAVALQRESWDDIVAVHSAGALGVAPLADLVAKGAIGLALHPNVALLGDGPIPPSSVWGITPVDSYPQILAAAILQPLAPRFMPVDDDARTTYHTAASVASNFAVTLYAFAERLYEHAGVDAAIARELVGDFMSTSVERSLAESPRSSLTGPVRRGDDATIAKQRAAVAQYAPELVDLFDALARATRELLTPDQS